MGREWSCLIPIVQFILNTTKHSSTGMSPYDMLYGQHLAVNSHVIEIILGALQPTEGAVDPNDAGGDGEDIRGIVEVYVKELRAHLEKLTNMALRQLEETEYRSDKRHNEDVEPTIYENGDLVLLTPVDRAKLDASQLGPYKLIDMKSDQVFVLQSVVDSAKTHIVHASRVIPFHLRSDVTKDDVEKLAQHDANVYDVELVLEHLGTKRGDVFFKVRWSGFSADDDTWEPWSHVYAKGVLTKAVAKYLLNHMDLAKTLRMSKKKLDEYASHGDNDAQALHHG
jgi:hypothetical protein